MMTVLQMKLKNNIVFSPKNITRIKNNGDDTDFKKINEAYETLSNDESRKEYNIKRIFKNIDFTNEEYKLLFSYYDKFINSKEYRLMKLLYNSIPEHVKNTIWDKFKKSNYW